MFIIKMKTKPKTKKPPKSATIKLGKKICSWSIGGDFFVKIYENGYKIRKIYQSEITINKYERDMLFGIFKKDIDEEKCLENKKKIIEQLEIDEEKMKIKNDI